MTYPVNTSLITCQANRSNTKRTETRHLVLHETVSQADARRQLNFFNTGDREASVHGFIDASEILLTLPLNEIAWHVGPRANGFTEGYELCRASNAEDFRKQWQIAVWWFAKRCRDYGRGADFIMSHDEISKLYGGTDHTDPVAYFKQYGKTVDGFREDVSKMIGALAAIEIIGKIYSTVTAAGEKTAANFAANAVRNAFGLGITQILGKPDLQSAERMINNIQYAWRQTASQAIKDCLHIAADALRNECGIQ